MEKQNILLSIVIPVYNAEQYLEQCLDSICNQWKNGVEVILIDDGSKDKTGMICDYYAQKYEDIHVIHQENKGIGGARNSGLQNATGKYIAWIDADDWVTDEYIDTLLWIILHDEPDCIVFDHYINNQDTERNTIYNRVEGKVPSSVFCEDVIRDVRLQSMLWDKVMTATAYEELFFIEDRMPLEDYELMPRLVMRLKNIIYVKKPLYHYRILLNSSSHGHNCELSWHSYKLAQKRVDEVGTMYKRAAMIARNIQGFYFIRRYYLEKKPVKLSTQYKETHKIMIQTAKIWLVDKEVSVKWKLKFIYAICGFVFY